MRKTQGLIRRCRIGPWITRRARAIRHSGAWLARGPGRARCRVVAHAEGPAHAARAASIRDGGTFSVHALARYAPAPGNARACGIQIFVPCLGCARHLGCFAASAVMPRRACNALGLRIWRSRRSLARAGRTRVQGQARHLIARGRHRPVGARSAYAIAHLCARLAHEAPSLAVCKVSAYYIVFARAKRAARACDTRAVGKRSRLREDALTGQTLGRWRARRCRIVVAIPRVRGARALWEAATRAVRARRAHIAICGPTARTTLAAGGARSHGRARGLVRTPRLSPRLARRTHAIAARGALFPDEASRRTRTPGRACRGIGYRAELAAWACRA